MTETSQRTAPTESTAPTTVQRVDKPCGHEGIFAVVEGSYVGRLLTVRAGAVPLPAGMSVHVPPGLLHRLRALDDSMFVEASTAAPGWREDVVRLEDSYGRDGTSAP